MSVGAVDFMRTHYHGPFDVFDVGNTMDFVGAMLDSESISHECHQSIMRVLINIRNGLAFDDDDKVIDPNGAGWIPIWRFFVVYGYRIDGGRMHPVRLDLVEEGDDDEEEKKDEETDIIDDDLISDVTVLSELDAIELMNDDIGDILDTINPTVERFSW